MMTDNLTLWKSVERTPLEHTKPITGKSYSGTSPKPHWIIWRATETFGPCGIGWGFTVEERVENGALIEPGFYQRLHIAKVKVWYVWDGKRGEVEHIGGTEFSGKRSSGKPFTDEDAPKKSVTDALVKALSMIGFAGDIFMGRYDDSKYVSELREGAQDKVQQAVREASEAYTAGLEAARACTTKVEIRLWWNRCKANYKAGLPADEYKALFAAVNGHAETLPENDQTEERAA